MDHGQLSMVADKFQWVFSEPLLNACGTEAKFCRRQRIITPFRLGLALTATCASQPVETLADFHRGFNALWGTTITYKAFYNQVAKSRFADFARTMTSRLIGDMTLKVLGFAKGRAFAEFRHIVLQDGSSFAIHDGLREVFPGRFKVVKPAAVELHTTMDLLCDTPTTVVLTPDTTNEQAFLPEPASLRASVLLADRGSLDLHYLRRLQGAGGFCIIRAKAGMNPQVVEAFREDGKRLRSLRNKPLKAIHAKLPKRQRVELVVEWQVEEYPLRLRLLISWNRQTKEFCYLLTNLPAQRYPLDMIYRAYKWRWQVELLFKEWKSYANLHAFDTENPAIVEGLIWAAIAAAALKRFLAHMPQRLLEVPMSTRKVAMCAVHVLGRIVQALKTGDVAGLYDAIEAAIMYLACHAQRAHPKRDRHTGRSQLGLEPLFGSDDLMEFVEAA
ncbi:MAG TPA: IS4 family transposase [Candidatus Saccharimonadia bacterium]|nr:IS4 family transposase [Candidatus Saccharimonadia bacterium]